MADGFLSARPGRGATPPPEPPPELGFVSIRTPRAGRDLNRGRHYAVN